MKKSEEIRQIEEKGQGEKGEESKVEICIIVVGGG